MATLNISITVPDDQQTRIINSFCQRHRYDSESGLTKLQFIKRTVAAFIKESTMAIESEIARQAKLDEVRNIPID